MDKDKGARKKHLESIEADIQKGNLICSADPIEWFFEISKRCNIRCLTCGRIYDDRFNDPRFEGNMSLSILDKVENHLAQSFVVHSVGFGEPFVNRHALTFFRTIKKHELYLDVITNGTLLEDKEDDLIESGLDSLIVSMDGGTEGVFEHFRAGAKWDKVTRSLKKLYKEKQKRKAVKPQVFIEFVAMAGNLHTFPELVRQAASEWGATGIAVEPLYKSDMKGYFDFYMEQNLSTMPFKEVEALFVEAHEVGTAHGLTFSGPYYDGDRRALWENARFMAISNIEFPRPGIVVDGLTDFHGWALHPAGVEKVTFHLGDQEEKPARFGESRPDVEENMSQNFPGKEKSGFTLLLEPGLLEEGENLLHLTIYDKNGGFTHAPPVPFIFAPIVEENAPPVVEVSETLHLDMPCADTPMEDPHLVVGWCHPPVPEGLKVYLENHFMGEAVMGVPRPDVGEAIHHPEADRCGFFMPLDMSDLDDGTYSLRITQLSRGEEGEEMLCMPVTLARGAFHEDKVTAEAQGAIESPGEGQPISGKQAFSGWAVYGPDVQRVRLLCDGAEVVNFCHDFPRREVRARFPEKKLSDRIGFAALVDTENLAKGSHTFSLNAVHQDRSEKALAQVNCTVGVNNACTLTPEALGKASTGTKLDEKGLHGKTSLLYKDPTRKTTFAPFCTFAWTTTYIAFDGKVRSCCYSEPSISLGDLNHQSFEEVWNGEAYQRFRWEILNRIIPDHCKGCMASVRIHGRRIFDKFKPFLE